MVFSYNGILYSSEEQRTITSNNLDDTQTQCVKRHKRVCIVWVYIYKVQKQTKQIFGLDVKVVLTYYSSGYL